MANDNQTALGMSIKRKKDRVEDLETQLKQKSKSGIADGIYDIAVELRVLRSEITEDEKLLPVDREQWVDAYATGAFHFCELELDDPTIRKEGNDNYKEKYGTDGK